MNRLTMWGLAAGLAAFAALPAEARTAAEKAVDNVFGRCGDPCVITYSPGGSVTRFVAAARAVQGGGKRLVVIDGPCISACAIFADVARDKVCVTERAQFGFHQATLMRGHKLANGRTAWQELSRSDPPHSADIARWVERRGGFPAKGFRVMGAKEAGSFWKRCTLRR